MAEAIPIAKPAALDGADRLAALEGDWDASRTGGLLPPMWGVWKEVRSYLVDRLRLETPDFIDGVGTMYGRDYCHFVIKRIPRSID